MRDVDVESVKLEAVHSQRRDSLVWWVIAGGTLVLHSYKLVFAESDFDAIPRTVCRLSFLPFIWLLQRYCQRWPIEGPRISRNAAIHVSAAFAYSTIQISIFFLIMATSVVLGSWSLTAQILTPLANYTFEQLPNSFTFTFMWYWAVVSVIHAFSYYFKFQETTAALARISASVAESQLATLRHQLSPHFLFNTLNGISAFALRGDRERVVDMIASLSTLLRIATDSRRPNVISLEDELEFTTRYLELQQIRFADRLDVTWDIDPDIKSSRVPSMILQPLVENAIKHGMGTRPGPARIRIGARPAGDMLQMEVSDSGPGFDSTRAVKHVGLTNTEARLKQMYGGAHHVDYKSTRSGASVTISIPLE